MLCTRCYKNIPQSKKVKLKDGSIVCNKCAERIFKEYHKERYRKYLKGEIDYEELDPEGGRPIDDKFLEIPCVYCLKSIAEYSEEMVAKSSTVFYDKCKGKKCPDCGKVRQEIHVKIEVFKDGFAGYMVDCPRCKKQTGCELNGVCWNCFWEREEGRGGCICIVKHAKFCWRYYCHLCEEEHVLNFRCGKCAELIEEGSTVPLGKRLLRPWQVIVPSFFGGVIIGTVMGFIFIRKFKRIRKPRR